jgi:hypothetical protein
MAKHGTWTVIVVDKKIIKKTEDFSVENPCAEKINDDAFWNQSKFSNISAIQFTDDNVDNDQVEYTDTSPNGSYDSNVLGDFRTEFINRFDAAHLATLQSGWDNNNHVVEDPNAENGFRDETEAEKIARLGARPASYTSA